MPAMLEMVKRVQRATAVNLVQTVGLLVYVNGMTNTENAKHEQVAKTPPRPGGLSPARITRQRPRLAARP
jgi:hypothetical protein